MKRILLKLSGEALAASDGILDGAIPPEKHEYYLGVISAEVHRLSRLVTQLLDVSRLESGERKFNFTNFDIAEMARIILISFEQKITAKKINVEVDLPENHVSTMANQDYIIQVIYNLLDNAVKFCPSDGTLGLQIRLGTNKAYVSVSNDGQTIPAEELPLVFDRFHKIDKSRSQNRESWGLGLYIVRTIVCSHGENISVTSKNGRTEFTFTMPLVN